MSRRVAWDDSVPPFPEVEAANVRKSPTSLLDRVSLPVGV